MAKGDRRRSIAVSNMRRSFCPCSRLRRRFQAIESKMLLTPSSVRPELVRPTTIHAVEAIATSIGRQRQAFVPLIIRWGAEASSDVLAAVPAVRVAVARGRAFKYRVGVVCRRRCARVLLRPPKSRKPPRLQRRGGNAGHSSRRPRPMQRTSRNSLATSACGSTDLAKPYVRSPPCGHA
jgi:hypothetical protein